MTISENGRCVVTGSTVGPFLDSGLLQRTGDVHLFVDALWVGVLAREIGVLPDDQELIGLEAEVTSLREARDSMKAQLDAHEEFKARVRAEMAPKPSKAGKARAKVDVIGQAAGAVAAVVTRTELAAELAAIDAEIPITDESEES